jgi:hypothetical protein
VLPLFAILLAVAIIYLSATKRAGIKKIAWTLITAGLTAVLFAVLGVWALQAGTSLLGASESSGIQDKLLAVFTTLAIDLRTWWFGIGVGYTVTGIIMLIVLRFTRPEPTLTMGNAAQNTPLTPSATPPVPPTTPAPVTVTPPSQNSNTSDKQ